MNSYKKFFAWIIMTALGLFIIITTMNYIVDPYNFNQKINVGMHKDIISYRGNYRLYKLQAFKNHPTENIYLGDSRMDALDNGLINNISGEQWFNFAYGGGTAYEIIDSFWFAAKQTQLKKVVIGIDFDMYNGYSKMNLVPEAEKTISMPWRYYLSWTITKMSVSNIIYKLSAGQINLQKEKPAMNKDEFWIRQLDVSAAAFYNRYKHPDDLQSKLQEIVSYCADNKIQLTFVFPPTHIDLQRRIKDFGLTAEHNRYKSEIYMFGVPVYDFDIESVLTTNRDDYKDPYHAGINVRRRVIETVWSKTAAQ